MIRYKEIIDLGAKRFAESDRIFFDKYGYDWFRVELKLSPTIYIDWDCNNYTCSLITINKEHDILNKWVTDDIELVKNWVAVFRPTKK